MKERDKRMMLEKEKTLESHAYSSLLHRDFSFTCVSVTPTINAGISVLHSLVTNNISHVLAE